MFSKIKVDFLDSMGGDLDVVNAARVSFGAEKEVLDQTDEGLIEYLATGLRKKERQGLIQEILACQDPDKAGYLIDVIQAIVKHWSPFTHVFLKFRFHVPLFVANQIKRSTVGFSINEISRRYVSDEPEFLEMAPADWRGRAADVKQGSGATLDSDAQRLAQLSYEQAMKESFARYGQQLTIGVAPEQARAVLPQATFTTFIWTANLYAWANLCKQRIDPHAQHETRVAVLPVWEAMKQVAPISTKALLRK